MDYVREKELLERASVALRIQPAALMRRVSELGRTVGVPWSQDEKFATVAAWMALASKKSSLTTTRSKS
jgi:hypothetical protein